MRDILRMIFIKKLNIPEAGLITITAVSVNEDMREAKVFLSLISLYIGFGAEHIQVLSSRIANELMNSQQYIDTVLNNS